MWFPAKIKQLCKRAGYYVFQKLEFHKTIVMDAVKSYYHLCRDTLPVFFGVDLSPCCASIQPMS